MDKHFIITVSLLILISTAFAQLIPYIQGLFVDNAILTQNTETLIKLCVVVSVLLILDAICRYFLNNVCSVFGFYTAKNINNDMLSQILKKPYKFFERNSKGDILYRTNTYIYDVGKYISNDISSIAINLARILIIFVFILVLEPFFAFCLLALYSIVFAFIFLLYPILQKRNKNTIKAELYRNTVILENIEAMETYLAYTDSPTRKGLYAKANKSYGDAINKQYTITHFFTAVIDFFVLISTVLIYVLAFNQTLSIFEVGIIVSVLAYVAAMTSPIQSVIKGLVSTFKTSAVLNEVFKYPANKISKENIFSIKKLPTSVNITCKNVNYVNKSKKIFLHNINFNVKAGEKIMVVAAANTGKSSFADLLCGLNQPDSGEILFNDFNIKNYTREQLSSIVSMTSDVVGIFKASVYDNVKFAKPQASEAQILNALNQSGLSIQFAKFKDGVKTQISNRTISESTKQLISLARVLLKDTPVVIVDEAPRDLQDEEKRKFWKIMLKHCENKTLIYFCENQKGAPKILKKYNN